MIHRSHFLLVALSCANISLNAMKNNSQQEQPLTPYVRTIQFAGFNPNFQFEPKPLSTFGEEIGNELLNLIKEAKITQNTTVLKDPTNGNEVFQSAPSQIELRDIEKLISTMALKNQEEELKKTIAQNQDEVKTFIQEETKKLNASKADIEANTRAEEAAKLSVFQRNPKKTILGALLVGAVTPFVLPELLKKAGL